MSAINLLHANVGKTIAYSLVIAVPAAIAVAFLYSRTNVPSGGIPLQTGEATKTAHQRLPHVAWTLFTILLPVFLMLLRTVAELALPKENVWRTTAEFIGNPTAAMLIAVLFGFWSLGLSLGITPRADPDLQQRLPCPARHCADGGRRRGGFKEVLIASGVGEAIQHETSHLNWSPLVLAWLIAAGMRIATGSASVAVMAAAGLMAPLAEANPKLSRELLVLSAGSGSLILSHLNDGGFWLVKEYLGLTVADTLRTWTVLETIISVIGLGMVLGMSALPLP